MKERLLLAAICMASFLGCLDLTIVNTALPAIQHSTGALLNTLQWIMTGLFLALSATMVLAGRLADVFGHRCMMLIGLIFFGISSLIAALAPNIYLLIVARILQGFGIAVLYTVPPAIINHLFDKDKIAKAIGLYFSVSSIGIASGPLLGGFIVAAASWRWIFLINIPFVIISFVICALLLTEDKKLKKEKLDLLGAVLLSISLTSLLLVTVHLDTWGIISLTSLMLIAVFVFSLIAFIFHEMRYSEPMLNLKLFSYLEFTLSGFANIGLACFYSVAFFLMPLYLHVVKGLNVLNIGFMLLPATIVLSVVSPFIDRLIARFSSWYVLGFGFACFTASAFLQQGFSEKTSLLVIIISYGLLGLGWAFILSPSFSTALTAIPKEYSGVATGTLGTLHNAGGAIGLAIGTLLFNQKSVSITTEQFVNQQHSPFIFIGAIAAVLATMLLVHGKRVKNNIE